ncbi:PadR family transcriptional regulator [Bradyrhizobium genosp. L]|uniref:PadR family transcriptional regulator n=1 Tax=Bradyrhizobium genosp. L TaxID=83637 RepID=UPI0018A331F0|nr:PadR family transcriptional regulator [Bradyrhizobium genosp. L]QPF87625.1 PadR family transcriptional regulator [Bradyrhizobium genosp. L]
MRKSFFHERDDDGFRFGFAIGRHGRGHRFGHGGRGFFFGRGGGGDFPGSRRLSSEDLQLVILALLGERPAHGYELIKLIEERSDGFYSPSPGVIYPALTFLEEIGHASVTQDAARKLYNITEQGKAHLVANRTTADAILAALSRIGRRMEDVREAFAGVSDFDTEASDELHRARHALKSALRHKRGSDAAEARRIAKILERAAAEILQQ